MSLKLTIETVGGFQRTDVRRKTVSCSKQLLLLVVVSLPYSKNNVSMKINSDVD